MVKKRLISPYQLMWLDKNGQLHVCNYLTCDDGCECESTSGSIDFYKKGINKAEKLLKRIKDNE